MRAEAHNVGQSLNDVNTTTQHGIVDSRCTQSVYVYTMDRRESTASQETFISLQQLDPSPIESPEYELDKQLPELPVPSPPPRSSTLGLSGSGHSSVYYCMSPSLA
jgi:hypothetical protein